MASSNLSQQTGHPGKDIRPCVAALTETSLARGGFPNRNEAAVIIASEFKRISLDYDSALKRVEYWNRKNAPPLKPNEAKKAVANAYGKDYNYSCRHPVLLAFCVDESVCPFHNQVLGKKDKYNDLAFIDYGWQKLLSNRQVLIYKVALPHLEMTRKIGRGGLICANHQQIANACGIHRKRIGKDLKALAEVGLIEYEPGQPKKWEGKASEIGRVYPIPRPRFKNGGHW
ncbi:MAG: hypothetical protein KAT58_00925 [candidate division Zixibacteria bacterium]|nr:hypothetical protein [candidate division Zixibacteria bacterium]